MKTCIACSMPMTQLEDFGNHDKNCESCVHCTNPDGSVKSCEEIFDGGVQFFMNEIVGTDRAFAERLSRKTMKDLPYWKGNDCECMKGESVTDEEFQKALKKFEEA